MMTKLTENSMMNRYFFSYPAVKDFFTHTYVFFSACKIFFFNQTMYLNVLYQRMRTQRLDTHSEN